MMRPFLWPNWRNVLAVVMALVLSVGVTALIVGFQKRPLNFGFGPEWKCSQTIGQAPACIKEQPKTDAPLLHSN